MGKLLKICPKCGSLDMSILPNKNSRLRTRLWSNCLFNSCSDCGYEGVFPEIGKETVPEFQKNLKKN